MSDMTVILLSTYSHINHLNHQCLLNDYQNIKKYLHSGISPSSPFCIFVRVLVSTKTAVVLWLVFCATSKFFSWQIGVESAFVLTPKSAVKSSWQDGYSRILQFFCDKPTNWRKWGFMFKLHFIYSWPDKENERLPFLFNQGSISPTQYNGEEHIWETKL